MKTILFFLIAIFIFGTFSTSFSNKVNNQNKIIIQSVDNNVSTDLLGQSAKIISERLKDFGSEKFNINLIPEKNQIQIIVPGKWDLKVVENLVIQKGRLAFYETFDHISLTELLNEDKQLFKLLNDNNTCNPVSETGCTNAANVENINNYIKTLELGNKCRFAWGKISDNARICLYALKTDNLGGCLIAGKDIENVWFKQEKQFKTNEVEIKLKEPAIKLWAEATKRNINKAIAIVLDDTVIAAPIVMSAIEGGNCYVTGNYTETEARVIASVADNGELPVSFKIVK